MARKHAPSAAAPAVLDPIEALRRAIIQAAEQKWELYAMPEAERVHLRPGVLAIANEATARLRAEHVARIGATP